MQVNELDRPTLRRLAELKPKGAKVLSLFMSLDPSEFATPPARASAVSSLCDEAERRVRAEDRLDHRERTALLEDVRSAREFFARGDYARGARGLALYCCRPAGLFEAIRLPRPVDFGVVIDDSPFVEPLADLVSVPEVCVVLVNRRTTRLLCGSSEGLREVASFHDDVHGQHDQGGWSQARYQRSIQEEVDDHLRRTADALFRHLQQHPADVLIGAPAELRRSFESRLHSQVRGRVVGHVDVDVEHSSPEQVHREALEVLEARRRERERELLDRLQEGLGGTNRAAAGLEDVLSALYERRVEALLYRDGLRREGQVCPQCGWMSASVERCPVDGEPTETRPNVIENAVESAIAQSAEVVVVHHHADEMAAFDGVGALLRF
jgi:peptide chain release factor subunit 1